MKIDLDQIALDVATDMQKAAIPPKVYSKLRLWLKKLRSTRPGVRDVITQKAEELGALQSLKKNEVMTSFFDSGIMKMDFGADVSDSAKRAALRWAKRRGLKVVEASLAKSAGSPTSYTLGMTEDIVPHGKCVKRVKWSV